MTVAMRLTGCQIAGTDSAMLEPHPAGLEKHAPIHDQLRRPDRPEQNIFLRAVGPADLQHAFAPDQFRPDRHGPPGDLPITGRDGFRAMRTTPPRLFPALLATPRRPASISWEILWCRRSWPSGPAYDGSQPGVPAGRLVCFSVFGTLKADGSPFGGGDCPGGTDVNGRSYTGLAMTSAGRRGCGTLNVPTPLQLSWATSQDLRRRCQERTSLRRRVWATNDGLNDGQFPMAPGPQRGWSWSCRCGRGLRSVSESEADQYQDRSEL